jgi:4-amino-4-deoxy-L-arabinose transferase-like glycosyltransferase
MTATVAAPTRNRNREGATAVPGRRSRLGSLWRGRHDDPPWVRPALLILLTGTAVLYIWGLGASGWANSFYAAAVQASTKSWKAFFFGSFDASNFITVDKSPGSLWVMDLSARIFGLNSWSLLLPQALEGVATVGVVYLTVRRWFPPAAALAAGVVTALTPVAALMFRYDNPDAFMVLLLTLAAYTTVRAVEDGRTRWIAMTGALVGFAFLAKMLQGFLVVPAIALVYLVAAPGSIGRRIRQLLLGLLALVLSAGWWIAVVQLTPASARPYIGGSQDNSLWNLIFGYNGFGRLTGNETGSVGGGGRGGVWGATGLTRLFGADMGTQISWLLPAALILLVVGLYVTRRAPRRNRARAALLLWGGWLMVTGLVFSLGRGIIHPYYTVALAPAIGGVVGSAGYLVWAHRHLPLARSVLALSTAATAVWAFVLLDRTPNWFPWLRVAILVVGLLAAAGFVGWRAMVRPVRVAIATGAALAVLAAPAAYTLDTVNTAHSGAIPSAGPVSLTGFAGGPGGRGGPGGAFRGGAAGGLGAGAPGVGGQAGGAFAPGAGAGTGTGGRAGTGTGGGTTAGGFPNGRSQPTGGNSGGLLNASRPNSQLVAMLAKGAKRYSWVAAAVGANEAAGYQLATGDPVMAIGGFNGTDPYPTLTQFEQLVREGKIHYFIVSGGGATGAAGGPGAGSTSASSAIESWVTSHFRSTTVDGVTLYDLSTSTGS